MYLNKEYISISLLVIALILGVISTSGSKSQFIRIIDILVIGPLMFYLGYLGYIGKVSNITVLYLVLMFFGGTTITYNLYNYLVIAKIL